MGDRRSPPCLLQCLDGVHDAIGEGFVAFFAGVGFKFFFREDDGGAYFYGDAGEADFCGAAWQCLVGPVDADGLDGDACFCDDEADAGCGVADFTIHGALAFREDKDAPAFFELADDGFHGGHVWPVLIDWDGVPLWVDPFGGAFEEGFTGEEDHFVFVEVPDEGGVKEALVI